MSDQPTVNLNVTDISDAVKVIDHACEQGAFRGWANIRQILALRDRLDMFSVAAAAITNPETAAAPAETDADDPEVIQQILAASPAETDTEITEDSKPKVTHPRRQRGTRMSART